MSGTYVLRRLIQGALTAFLSLSVIFIILRLTPGDPAMIILGDYATPELLAIVRQEYGLDKSVPEQYLIYLRRIVTGDFGASLVLKKEVTEIIFASMRYTAVLAVGAVTVTCLIGIPLGIVAARKRNTLADYVSMVIALLGISTPGFWLGLLLIFTFSYLLGWFPIQGAGNPGDVLDELYHLILPAFTLGFSAAALVARTTRSSLLEVMNEDYVRTARAKGLAERMVFLWHIWRNALIPIVTVLGINLAQLLGGAAVAEIVFGRPGLGKTLVDSILARDYPLSQAMLVTFLLAVVMVNLITDLIYGIADPRIARS
ncbi:MAG: ABC transporter permease [Chloroflexi bacterium]|nr:ABC transporter permease [Chloroflexota bacterium]